MKKNSSSPPQENETTTSLSWQRKLMYTQSGRIFLFGWLGIIGFPLYYWIWAVLFPQPYENLPLRLIGTIICIPLVFSLLLKEKKWMEIYFYGVITYAFPFFFIFMYLMNGASAAWSQSLVIMLIIIFSFNIKITVITILLGAPSAIFAYYFNVENLHLDHLHNIIENFPTMVFSITVALIIKIGRKVSHEEKLSTLATGISTAAHELRNPLASMAVYIGAIERYISKDIETNQPTSLDVNSKPLKNKIAEGLTLIKSQIFYSDSMINILVTNAWKGKNKIQSKSAFEIKNSIIKAIDLYPFFNKSQSKSIKLNLDHDFRIQGDEKLFILILHNLIKNSYKAISRGNHKSGIISIETTLDKKNHNCLIFKDNGCGIKKKHLSSLFQRFFSYPANSGTGIGLAFCRDVLSEWGAEMTCTSKEYSYTEFTIAFPLPN